MFTISLGSGSEKGYPFLLCFALTPEDQVDVYALPYAS